MVRLFLALTLLAGFCYAQPPSLISPPLPEVAGCGLTVGDFDADGDPDLFVAGDSAGQKWSRILRNDLSNFVCVNMGIPDMYYAAADWGDHDLDGDLDLLFTGYSGTGPVAAIWENNGLGALSPTSIALAPTIMGTADWEDLDADGDLDIVLTGQNSFAPIAAYVYENDGTGNYTPRGNAGLLGAVQGAISFADDDGDLMPEALVIGYGPSGKPETHWYKNLGNCQFQEQPLGLPLWTSGEVDLVDMNADGVLEVLALGESEGRKSGIFTLSTAGWSSNTLTPEPLSHGSIQAADFNTDGFMDFAICGEKSVGGQCRVYRQQSGGTFVDHQPANPIPALRNTTLRWLDWNQDGFLDLVMTGVDDTGSFRLQLITYEISTQLFKP